MPPKMIFLSTDTVFPNLFHSGYQLTCTLADSEDPDDGIKGQKGTVSLVLTNLLVIIFFLPLA